MYLLAVYRDLEVKFRRYFRTFFQFSLRHFVESQTQEILFTMLFPTFAGIQYGIFFLAYSFISNLCRELYRIQIEFQELQNCNWVCHFIKVAKEERTSAISIIKQIDIFFLIKYFPLNYFGNKNDAREMHESCMFI